MVMLVTTRGSHPRGRAPLSAPPSSPAIKGPSISLNKSIWDIKEFVPRSRMVSEQISVSPRISLLLSGSLDLRIFQDLENEDLRVCPSYPKKLVLTLIMAMWKKKRNKLVFEWPCGPDSESIYQPSNPMMSCSHVRKTLGYSNVAGWEIPDQ